MAKGKKRAVGTAVGTANGAVTKAATQAPIPDPAVVEAARVETQRRVDATITDLQATLSRNKTKFSVQMLLEEGKITPVVRIVPA
jgi:hypothetical protein